MLMFTFGPLPFYKKYADTFSTSSTSLVKLIKRIHLYYKTKTSKGIIVFKNYHWCVAKCCIGYDLRNAGLYICTCFWQAAYSFWFGILTFEFKLLGICESWQKLMQRERYSSVIIRRKEDITVFADRFWSVLLTEEVVRTPF